MLWKEIEDRAEKLGAQRKMVFREEMQKSILTALALKGCFDRLVFQGGTALRLFHGNPRFSEDIDLVLNQTKELSESSDGVLSTVLASSLPGVEQSVRDTFPFIDVVEIRTQKNDPPLQRYVLGARSDDPEHTLRVHIELAAIPSYRNTPRILDFPPVHPAVRVEGVDEILADKLCALALRPYLKGRDIWDIYYLVYERYVKVDWSLVHRKVEDYGGLISGLEDRSDDVLEDGLERAREKIRNDGSSILKNEMERFLPKHVLESYRTSFDSILESVIETTTGQDASPGE